MRPPPTQCSSRRPRQRTPSWQVSPTLKPSLLSSEAQAGGGSGGEAAWGRPGWGQPSELRCVVTVLQTACGCLAAGLTHLPSACGKGTGGLNPPRKPPCHRAATGGVWLARPLASFTLSLRQGQDWGLSPHRLGVGSVSMSRGRARPPGRAATVAGRTVFSFPWGSTQLAPSSVSTAGGGRVPPTPQVASCLSGRPPSAGGHHADPACGPASYTRSAVS